MGNYHSKNGILMDLIRRIKPAHLRLLLKIAEVGQLQIAASVSAISQPAASRILTEIERDAGAALFHRTPKGMETTPVGDAFMRHARVIVGELDSLEKEIKELTTGLGGEVRIGTVTGSAVGVVIPVLQKIRERAPKVAITIEVGTSTELVRGLEEGRFDFIIARLPAGQNSREFMVYPGRTEIVELIVRDTHPLATKTNVSLEAASSFDWVIQERGSPIRQAVENAYHNKGITVPQRVINSSSLLVVQAIISSSDTIAPQSKEVSELLTGNTFGARLTKLQLRDEITVSPYFVIRSRARQLPRAAAEFFDRVLQEL